MPINGEITIALTVDFQVKIPIAVNPDQVNAIVSRYVLAGKNYEIIN